MLLDNVPYAAKPVAHTETNIRYLHITMLPEHLRPVVVALLSGATDVAASHRLNCSPRTFSRRVSELLELLDVETRFQAGVKLAFHSVHERSPILVSGPDDLGQFLTTVAHATDAAQMDYRGPF